MDIKVLGGGCANCKRLEKIVRDVVTEMGVDATISKVTDFRDIMAYDILTTPGLVIDEKVVCSGRVPSKADVTVWVVNALASEEA